jgi:hypothetical protein
MGHEGSGQEKAMGRIQGSDAGYVTEDVTLFLLFTAIGFTTGGFGADHVIEEMPLLLPILQER